MENDIESIGLETRIKLSINFFDENMKKSGIEFNYDSDKDKINKLLRIYRFIIKKYNDTFLPVEQIHDAFNLAYDKDEIDSLCHELVRRTLLIPDFDDDGKIVGYIVN